MKLTTLLILTTLTIFVSVYFDKINLLNESKSWFQASGALLIILGLTFESKYILRSNKENSTIFVGEVTIMGEDEVDKTISKKLTDHAGYYIILLGTLISGYGDIVTNLLIK